MFARSSKRTANGLHATSLKQRTFLIQLLIGPILIGLMAAPSPASAADLVDLESSFLREARQLAERYETSLRQAQAQGTPGTPSGPVSASEVQSLEQSLRSAQQSAQSLVGLPTSASSPGGRFLPIELKQQVIATYLELLTSAVTLRISLKWDHGASWRDALGLSIPSSQLGDFSDMASISQGRRGEVYSSVIIDRTADPARMRLSDSFVEGLEVGVLSDQTRSESALLLLVKYLTIRQLQDNLELTQRLQGKTPNVTSTFPSDLTRALPSLGLSESAFAQRRSVVKAAAFSTALRKAATEQYSSLPVFADSATLGKMAASIAQAVVPASQVATFTQSLVGPLTSVFTEAQSALWGQAIEDELRASDPLTIERGNETSYHQLRVAISGALANTTQRKLLELLQSGALVLPTQARIDLLGIISTRQKQIERNISATLLSGIIASAKTKTEYEITQAPRERLLDEIILGARDTSARIKAYRDGTALDFPALYKALSAKLQSLILDENRPSRPRLQAWLKELESAPSWTDARIRYTALFANELSPSALHEGQTEKARALAIISSDAVVPRLELPPIVSQEYRTHVIDTLAADIRADWKTLLKVGDLFALNWSTASSGAEPAPSKFLTDSSLRSAYQAELIQSLRDRYPVLAESVVVGTRTSFDGPQGSARTVEDKRILADEIAEIAAQETLDEAGFDRIGSLTSQALAQIEARIRKNISKVAGASRLKDIEPVLGSVLMVSQLMGIFPEFSQQLGKSIEALSRPSQMQILLDESIGNPMVTALFLTQLLAHAGGKLIKPIAPFTLAANYALEPLVMGYMRAFTIGIVADSLMHGYEVYRQGRSANLVADLYASTPAAEWTAGGFYTLGEVEATRSAFRISLAFYMGRLALEVPFVYWPLFKEIRFAMRGSWNPKDFSELYTVERSDFMMDVDAFRVMGVEPGNWQAINPVTYGKRILAAGESSQAERVINLAYARLRAKIAAGKTWTIIDAAGYAVARPGSANYSRTPSEQRLLTAFKRLTGGAR